MVGESIEHLLSVHKRRIDFGFVTARHYESQRHAAPSVFLFDKLAHYRRYQISGKRLGLLPIPGLHAIGLSLGAEELSIRDCDPRCGDGEQHFRGGAVVWIIVDGNVIAGVFGFALRPDFLGAVWIILVRQNEIKALLGLTIVANENVVMLAAFRRVCERNDEFFIGSGKFRVVAVQRYLLNGEIHGIKLDLFSPVPQHGNTFSHFATHFFLFDVEPQVGLDVLQIVVLAPGVGFISAGNGRK